MTPEDRVKMRDAVNNRLRHDGRGWQGSDAPANKLLREHEVALLDSADERDRLRAIIDEDPARLMHSYTRVILEREQLKKKLHGQGELWAKDLDERDRLKILLDGAERSVKRKKGYVKGLLDLLRRLKAERDERLLPLIEEFTDPDPCDYDHHGLCQAHNLHERPCPHERAKDL